MSSEIDLIVMPTPCCRRKAASGAPLGEVRSESPESLARGMLTKGISREPRRDSLLLRNMGTRWRPTQRHLVSGGRGLPPREANDPQAESPVAKGNRRRRHGQVSSLTIP